MKKFKKFETLKGFRGLKLAYMQALEIIVSNSKKENQLVVTKKINETNQKFTEIVVGESVQ